MSNPPAGFRRTTPGGEVQRLLQACEGDEGMLACNIRREPEHWIVMVVFATPWLLLARLNAAIGSEWMEVDSTGCAT